MPNAPSTGWYLEVEHPQRSTPRVPDIIGTPTYTPSASTQPTATVPVRRDEGWLDDSWDDATARLWLDGRRVPVDQLQSRSLAPGSTELSLVGGPELETRVQTDVDRKPAWKLARDLTQNNTSYATNFREPETTVDKNVSLTTVDSEADFRDVLSFDPEQPLIIRSDGSVEMTQTCWSFEGETNKISGTRASSDYSLGEATFISSGFSADSDSVTMSFTTEHRIPAEHVAINFRTEFVDGTGDGVAETPSFRVLVDGTEVTQEAPNTTVLTLEWRDFTDDYTGSDLDPGSHTLTVEVVDASHGVDGDELRFDVFSVYDDRYSYFFDNDNGGNDNPLDGPQNFPPSRDVLMENELIAQAVVGGRAELTIDDTSNNQAVALSNDGGASFKSASNTDVFETDFQDPGSGLQLRVTLSRYGTATTTPATGVKSQSLDAYSLFADLSSLRLIIERQFDASLQDVLRSLADESDSLFAYRFDDGTRTVGWAQSAQLVSQSDAALADYTVTQTTAEKIEKAVVRGALATRSREQITANHGTAVALEKDEVRRGRESVIDPNTGTSYERGVDYELDPSAGEITTLASGSITDGQALEVSYAFQTSGSAANSGATAETTATFDIPELPSDRACELAALQLLDDLEEPLQSAQITVSEVPPDWSVLEAIDPTELPGDGPYSVNSIDQAPGEVTLSLASRESAQDLIDDIRSRLQAVSKVS